MEELKGKTLEMIEEWNNFIKWDDTTICDTMQGLAHWLGRILNYQTKERKKVLILKQSLDKLKAKIHFECRKCEEIKYTKDDITMEFYNNEEYNELSEKLESAQTSLQHFNTMMDITNMVHYNIKNYLDQKQRIGC